jgi:rod shape-determining protein MreC
MGFVSFFAPVQQFLARPPWTRPKRGDDPRGRGEIISRLRALQHQATRQQEIIWQLSRELQALGAFRRQFPDLAAEAIPAEVLGTDASALRRSIMVDAGSADGVRVDCAVLVDVALVGRVAAVGTHASRVMLVTDPACAVPVLVTRTRDQGILEGSLGRDMRLSLQYLERSSQVRAGDDVLTSGLAGVFPKGIVVGKIAASTAESGALFRTVEVQPAVDLTKLERVLILRRVMPAAGEGAR